MECCRAGVFADEDECAEDVGGGYKEGAGTDDEPEIGSRRREVFKEEVDEAHFKDPGDDGTEKELESVFEGKDVAEADDVDGVEGEAGPEAKAEEEEGGGRKKGGEECGEDVVGKEEEGKGYKGGDAGGKEEPYAEGVVEEGAVVTSDNVGDLGGEELEEAFREDGEHFPDGGADGEHEEEVVAGMDDKVGKYGPCGHGGGGREGANDAGTEVFPEKGGAKLPRRGGGAEEAAKKDDAEEELGGEEGDAGAEEAKGWEDGRETKDEEVGEEEPDGLDEEGDPKEFFAAFVAEVEAGESSSQGKEKITGGHEVEVGKGEVANGGVEEIIVAVDEGSRNGDDHGEKGEPDHLPDAGAHVLRGISAGEAGDMNLGHKCSSNGRKFNCVTDGAGCDGGFHSL